MNIPSTKHQKFYMHNIAPLKPSLTLRARYLRPVVSFVQRYNSWQLNSIDLTKLPYLLGNFVPRPRDCGV